MKILPIFSLVLALFLFPLHHASAQGPAPKKARIVEIVEEGERDINNTKVPFQTVKIRFLDGEKKGTEAIVSQGDTFSIREEQKVKAGEVVLVEQLPGVDGQMVYHIADKYRLDNLYWIIGGFVALILLMSGLRGVGSLIGLAISFAVIVNIIVPQILAGRDPLLVSIGGSLIILVTTIYLAHGFSQKTTIAVVSTFLSLCITALLAYLFVQLAKLTGLGTEEAYSLRLGGTNIANFKGLLLGGIILGALGVLDDITTGQTAAVFELAEANKKMSMRELVKRGMTIGREHISSLVNTLVLAYAGASMPLFLFFVMNPGGQPAWMWLNSEFIAEEVIRTIAGSTGLILAVPITTVLAAWMVKRS